MEIMHLAVGMLGANCYILYEPGEPECIIIDPGGEAGAIIRKLDGKRIGPKYIVATHGHPDHIEAVGALLEDFPRAKILIHEADLSTLNRIDGRFPRPAWADPDMECTAFLREGDEVRCGDICLKVFHTPGHSPGGVCLYEEAEGCVFTGDTLFNGSVGRSDFPGGNFPDLERSIKEKLYCLPPDTLLYPGHSQSSTIGDEMQFNPFIRGEA